MRTEIDPDDEFFIPDVSGLDWQNAEVGWFARKPGEKTEVFIDGAVGHQLRLIPASKVLARFDSTLEAWPAIIAMIEGGRSPRTLALDAILAEGRVAPVSAGPRIERFAGTTTANRIRTATCGRWTLAGSPRARPDRVRARSRRPRDGAPVLESDAAPWHGAW